MAKNENTENKGLDADTTNPNQAKHKPKFTDNSLHNQRLKLLDYLFERGSISTSEAREKLDIYYPPARCFELRKAGYLIVTMWDYYTSEHGIKHRIGRYVLKQKQPTETIKNSGVAQ
ncbi:MAG: hypothetical protein CTY10_09010 [Methylotenera sp.]|nr:MAG: hypothetical protein CTY10_09010 [Methylotenera sp.]